MYIHVPSHTGNPEQQRFTIQSSHWPARLN